LTSNKFLSEYNFIKAQEYRDSHLNYPETKASNLYEFLIYLLNMCISDVIHKPNVTKELTLIIKNYINLNSSHCPKHDLLNTFLNSSIKLLIFSFIKEINLIIKIGKKTTTSH